MVYCIEADDDRRTTDIMLAYLKAATLEASDTLRGAPDEGGTNDFRRRLERGNPGAKCLTNQANRRLPRAGETILGS